MLTPEHIAALRDKAGQITDPVVEFLIADIADRISEAGQLTSTASYEMWKAQKLGVSQKQLKKELQKRLKASSKQLEQLLTQAAKTGYDFDLKRFPTADAMSFDENAALQQILDAAIQQAQEDFTNITQTMGFVGPDGKVSELTEAYQKACDFVFEKVTTGAQNYNSAIRAATKGLAEKGILSLDYESGIHRSVEAATRLNTMSSLGIMTEQITQNNHDALGCDGWEISAHMGSAPDHEPIQGKQYTDEEYTRLNNSLVRRIGTLNCGHSAMPVIMGVNDPQYTNEELEEFRAENEKGITYGGKHYTLYEATQRQSRLETSIRNYKRRVLIDEHLDDKDALQTDQVRLQLLKQEYSRFSKAAGIPMQHDRMEAAGFTWKHGKAAEQTAVRVERAKAAEKARLTAEAARKAKEADEAHKAWLKSIGAESTTLSTLDNLREAKYNNTVEYQMLIGYSKAVEKHDISPLVGFDLYQQTGTEIQKTLVGQMTSTGVEIQSFATHFIDRVIGQSSDAHVGMRQGVPIADVLDALKNPVDLGEVKELSNGDIRQTFYGKRAMVTISIRDHRLIQTNPQKGKK